ncbi:MAG: hypothetical protein RR806_06390 [Oscillospiraceae bacterium]
MEKSFTYKLCMILINAKRVVGLQEKLDVFYANGRLTDVEYTELCGILSK